MKNFVLILMILAFVDASGQIKIESALSQNAEEGEILIVDKNILNSPGSSEDPILGDLDFIPPHKLELNLPKDEDGRYIIQEKIRFVNCSFPENFILSSFNFKKSLIFEACSFRENTIFSNLKSQTMYFMENTFDLLILDSITTDRLIFEGDQVELLVHMMSSEINSQLLIDIESQSFNLTDNVFNIPEPAITLSDPSLFYEGKPTHNWIEVVNGEGITIRGNTFNGSSRYDILDFVFPDGEEIEIENNSFKGLLRLIGRSEFLTITGNNIDYFDVGRFSFPEFNASIEWDKLSGNRLINLYSAELEDEILEEGEKERYFEQMNIPGEWGLWIPQFYTGTSNSELLSKRDFDNLLASYYRIYTIFKEQGRIDDANSVYVEMKDLHGKRQKAVYNEDPSLKNFLKWKLNQLLKFYTEHGTEPIKAVIVSFYLLIFFGLFYFFFPSKWDEFDLDLEKWKKQGFRKSSFNALKHLLNSFVLSLNTFVTLGFGNIPTTGIPRYVCVLQGFVGWFLLSLFTVALINQTLF